MLKLKKNVKEFLKAHVKPDCLEWSIKNIEADASLNGCTNHWRIDESQTIHGVRIDFDLSIDCFEEVENVKELEPYKWYPRERWNGNPKGYWTVKRSTCYEVADTEIDTTPIHQLEEGWNYFMYIEPLEAEDDAS